MLSQIFLSLILSFSVFVISQKVRRIKDFKDKTENWLWHGVFIVRIPAIIIAAAAIIKNQNGYIAVNSAAQQAYSSCAPPAGPPENTAPTPAKPDLSDFNTLKTLISTAFIPEFQDFENPKTELILSDFYIQNYIAEKTAEAILYYNYQTLATTDFAAFEKKIYLEINRKLDNIKAAAAKYNFTANAIIASDTDRLLKKALLAYISYYSIRLQSLDTPISAGDTADKEQSLHDYIADSDDTRLAAGLDDIDEFDDIDIDGNNDQQALPLPVETETADEPARIIRQKAHRQPRQAQETPAQLGFGFGEVAYV